jgi:hypothetical protein
MVSAYLDRDGMVAIRLHAVSPTGSPRDLPAERMVSELRQTNAGLTRFKCVAKIIKMSGPERPIQSFRAAIAGQLTDRLRIDMFAPFRRIGRHGPVTENISSLSCTHPVNIIKNGFGSGSLQRIIPNRRHRGRPA